MWFSKFLKVLTLSTTQFFTLSNTGIVEVTNLKVYSSQKNELAKTILAESPTRRVV